MVEGLLANEAYTYDANGNRVTANGYVYSTGADNRLISDGTYTYAYDAEGNRTARFVDADADGVLDAGDTDITEYKWDHRNRLAEVRQYADFTALSADTPTQVVDYLYDIENRWIGEKIDSNGDGVVDHQIRFAYDGNQIVFQFDKQGGGPVTVDDLSHRYLWLPGAVDQLMADEQLTALPGGGYDRTHPGKVVWPLADHQGTIRDLAVYNAETHTTAVANHRVYDSYGKLEMQTDAAVDCLFGFTGRPFEKISGLQNNLNRWYDAKTGGWASKDPTGFASCTTNTVCYCHNSPGMYADSTGLWWTWTRLLGLLKFIGGAVEFVSGAALMVTTSWTGVGGVVGTLVFIHGIDVMYAGLEQYWSDEATKTRTAYWLLERGLGLSPEAAGWVDTAISIVGSIGASAWTTAIERGVAAGVGTTASVAGRTTLQEGEFYLGIVHDGKLIASGNSSLSHAEFVERTVRTLPPGAQVITYGKMNGEVIAMNSLTFHQNALPAPKAVYDVIRALFD